LQTSLIKKLNKKWGLLLKIMEDIEDVTDWHADYRQQKNIIFMLM
jgi:hypothetical protein